MPTYNVHRSPWVRLLSNETEQSGKNLKRAAEHIALWWLSQKARTKLGCIWPSPCLFWKRSLLLTIMMLLAFSRCYHVPTHKRKLVQCFSKTMPVILTYETYCVEGSLQILAPYANDNNVIPLFIFSTWVCTTKKHWLTRDDPAPRPPRPQRTRAVQLVIHHVVSITLPNLAGDSDVPK
jgi:hypothetical protein